jgi:hypothetical protein
MCSTTPDLTALKVEFLLIAYITFLIMTKGGERILVNQLLEEAKLLGFLGPCSASERERRRVVKIVA